MLIALDYDETYTRDPALWDSFLASAMARGHRVVCVTMRYPEEAVALPCEVIYTGRKAKKPFAEALMMQVDIWIDDAPHFILMDSSDIVPDAARAEAMGKGAGPPRLAAKPGDRSRSAPPALYRRLLGKLLATDR